MQCAFTAFHPVLNCPLQTLSAVLNGYVMREKLTPKFIDSLKPATVKRYEVRDILLVGLLIRVSKRGAKIWYAMPRVGNRNKRIKIGNYPVVSQAEAREKAKELLNAAQLGKFDELVIEQVPTLGELIPQFIELYAKPRNRDWLETSRILTKFVNLNHRPINAIKRLEIVKVLDGLAAKTPYRANRALAAIKKLRSCHSDSLQGLARCKFLYVVVLDFNLVMFV